MRLVVIGAGIAGLSGAYEASQRARQKGLELDVTILEANARAGGKLWTEHEEGVAVEWGPDSFVASKPEARELAEELGLEVVAPSPAAKRAYLRVDGVLEPFPTGLVMGVPRGPVVALRAARTRIVGPLEAVRAAIEPLLPGRVGDEAVAAATRRRLGRGWSKRLVEPLVEGVYGAPARSLGTAATLPVFAGHRSLMLAARRQPKQSDPAFLSIRGGMGMLVDRLVQELEAFDLRLRTPALFLQPAESGFVVSTTDGEIVANAVLVAVPAPIASNLLTEAAPSLAEILSHIRFTSSVVVMIRHERGSIGVPLDGSGYLVGADEGLAHAACSWLTIKWPNPDTDAVWLRAIVTDPRALREPQIELARRIADEVGRVVRASVPPLDVRSHSWEEALPLYGPGHLDHVRAAERALPPRLAVAGASYRGLGVPDCIRSGRDAGVRLVEQLLA